MIAAAVALRPIEIVIAIFSLDSDSRDCDLPRNSGVCGGRRQPTHFSHPIIRRKSNTTTNQEVVEHSRVKGMNVVLETSLVEISTSVNPVSILIQILQIPLFRFRSRFSFSWTSCSRLEAVLFHYLQRSSQIINPQLHGSHQHNPRSMLTKQWGVLFHWSQKSPQKVWPWKRCYWRSMSTHLHKDCQDRTGWNVSFCELSLKLFARTSRSSFGGIWELWNKSTMGNYLKIAQ